MKILLIYPPHRVEDDPRLFPTGMGIIAQVLRGAGHSVKVLDVHAHRWSRPEVERLIDQEDYDLAGIGGLTTAYGYMKWLAGILKERNSKAKVVVGGSVASPIPGLVLSKTQADIVVRGEGEVTVVELASRLSRGEGLEPVKGISYRENGTIRHNPDRELISNLDAVPHPAWDLFPMEIYLRYPIVGLGRDINIIDSRGCPYQCTYCYQIFGRNYRYRSVEKMMEEIWLLKKTYKIEFVSFQDDLFITDRRRVERFCAEVRAQKLGLPWSCTGRVNLVTEDLLRKMRAAGCISVSYGIESGSQDILDKIRKGVTVEQAKRAIELNRKVGLRLPTSFMLGNPGETRETAMETVSFCKEMQIPLQALMFATPYPGTPLWDHARERGLIPDEEAFILNLDDAVKFRINLTDSLSDQELQELATSMVQEVMGYVRRPSTLGRQWEQLRLYGPRLYLKGQWQGVRRQFREHRSKHGFNE